ncbi:MAG: transposase [Verrucomicrobiales bacterium]|nr:transposase [Verrucomicrobiales bacterium]
MALGQRSRQQRQVELFVPTQSIAQGPGHPFYTKLNEVLSAAGFDAFVEEQCAPFYKSGGRPGIPPGVYFRMLFVGYFEGIDSQRGIAWRCADSLALRTFLGYSVTEGTPVHVSMTIIRKRLSAEVFAEVFRFVLGVLQEHRLLRGKTIGIDATTLEANAAMKTIVRKDTGEDWNEYLRKLAAAEGIENSTDEDLRRMDRKRKGKKVSNQDWQSPTDPDSRIAKMKDGRTHLAYKAEHAVDLETEAIVAAEVQPADQGDPSTGPQTLQAADQNVAASGSETPVTELVADKGYHDNRLLAECAVVGIRTYIPERKQKSHRWDDKPAEFEEAFRGNRRRVTGERGRKLSRWRSERCERTFAHVCETGGGRRAWVRGITEVTKLHRMRCAAYNLGLLLRKVFGMAKPRCAEAGWAAFSGILALLALVIATTTESGNTDFLAVAMFGALLIVVLGVTFRKFSGTRIPNLGVL